MLAAVSPDWLGLPAVDVWRPLAAADAERFCLVWETKELVALNKTLITFLKNKVSLTQHRVPMMPFTAAVLHGARGPCLLHVPVHNGPASARQPFGEAELIGGISGGTMHLAQQCCMVFMLQSFRHMTSPRSQPLDFRQLPASCTSSSMLCVGFCAGNDGGWQADCGAPGGSGPGGCICPAHDSPGCVGHHRCPVSSHAYCLTDGHTLRCRNVLLYQAELHHL